jgi:molybdopterin converting factor subunit 1
VEARTRTAEQEQARGAIAVRVLLFAALREAAGARELTVTLPEGATVADLRAELAEAYPALAPLLPNSGVAVNQELAEPDAPLRPGDEVALIPPVSGG